MRYQRRILGLWWHDFVSNEEVGTRTGLVPLTETIQRQLISFGHVAHLRRKVPANQALRIAIDVRNGIPPSQSW